MHYTRAQPRLNRPVRCYNRKEREVVRLYTTPYCGYCVAAKRLLAGRNIPFREIDVARDPGLRQRISRSVDGYRTVPMIFIDDVFIGGYDELAELDRSGQLQAMIERTVQASAPPHA
jgi:glutaredoxin 3